MKLDFKVRLGLFVITVLAVFLALGVKTYSSWSRITEFRHQLAAIPAESFEIVQYFQHATLSLNNALISYGINRDPTDWQRFTEENSRLAAWIDQRKSVYRSDRERECLIQIDAAHTGFSRVAERLAEVVRSRESGPIPLAAYHDFEQATEKLLNLGYLLADTHRQNIQAILRASDGLLLDVGGMLLASLALIVGLGIRLAVVAYRNRIAPLQLKLVESREVIERQEKLAALGLLAAGVAHEIRNPLTAMKARLFTQKKVLHPGSPEHQDAEVIGHQIDRLERIVQDVLLFSRPSDPKRVFTRADAPLRGIHDLLAPQLESLGIRLVLENSPPAYTSMDPEQIHQALLNLVQNARDAIGTNGTITLRARCDTKRLGNRPAEVVILEVEDTGGGISAEAERRLFDPFFSTKERGTGLGLSIAARIVDTHGGALIYRTVPGVGTTFGIMLPRVMIDETPHQNPPH